MSFQQILFSHRTDGELILFVNTLLNFLFNVVGFFSLYFQNKSIILSICSDLSIFFDSLKGKIKKHNHTK